jgi:hypothetical protein
MIRPFLDSISEGYIQLLSLAHSQVNEHAMILQVNLAAKLKLSTRLAINVKKCQELSVRDTDTLVGRPRNMTDRERQRNIVGKRIRAFQGTIWLKHLDGHCV